MIKKSLFTYYFKNNFEAFKNFFILLSCSKERETFLELQIWLAGQLNFGRTPFDQRAFFESVIKNRRTNLGKPKFSTLNVLSHLSSCFPKDSKTQVIKPGYFFLPYSSWCADNKQILELHEHVLLKTVWRLQESNPGLHSHEQTLLTTRVSWLKPVITPGRKPKVHL